MDYAIIVPTLNGGELWHRAAAAIRAQQPEPARIVVVDSQSTDDTAGVARQMGFEVRSIDRNAFDHGRTRQQAVDSLAGVEAVVFLTQDAVPQSKESVHNLVQALEDSKVGAAYGRQVPRESANPIEAHARLFNYPDQSRVKDRDDIPKLGLRTAFCSNSFAAWRVPALQQIGGFAADTIFAEDMQAAARLILAGYRIAYVADAACEHSHRYSTIEEMRRAFDIGVFHAANPWLIDAFGRAEGEGRKFVAAELGYVARSNAVYLPLVFVRTFAKVVGYSLGKRYQRLPRNMCRRLSLNGNFWK